MLWCVNRSHMFSVFFLFFAFTDWFVCCSRGLLRCNLFAPCFPPFSCTVLTHSIKQYLWINVPYCGFVKLLTGHTSLILARPFLTRFALCCRTVVYLSCLSVCDIGILWPNSRMDQDAIGYGGRPRPRPDCVRWGPSSSTEMDTAAPTFRPISIVTKRSPILVTAELLYCVTLLNHYLHHTVVSFWKFINSCRMPSAVKLMSLFVACRCYCKFSDDEFQRKNKLEMIIKYIEYGLQGLDVFSAHCLYYILVHYAHWITSTV